MFIRGRMAEHEAHCCRNPDRGCGVCKKEKTNVVVNARWLIDLGLDSLKTELDGCPACILAAHIMANTILNKQFGDEDAVPYYEYKDAMKHWFEEHSPAGDFEERMATWHMG